MRSLGQNTSGSRILRRRETTKSVKQADDNLIKACTENPESDGPGIIKHYKPLA